MKKLSGDMQRRLDIAASIVATPRLILLDEPTTGLDPRSRCSLERSTRPYSSSRCPVALGAVADPEGVALALVDLSRAGIALTDFALTRPSLDQVFLALTGHALALILVFAFSLSYPWTVLGLIMRTPSSVMSVGFLIQFPLTLASNVFVDPGTTPGWVRAFIDANRVSHLVTPYGG